VTNRRLNLVQLGIITSKPVIIAGLTGEQCEAVTLLVKELGKGNPLASAALEMTDAMLNARCSQCAGELNGDGHG
jgi:hypothetical protein